MNHTALWLKDRNASQSATFGSPEAKVARQAYRADHPTEILATKCMDGRVNLSVLCQVLPGIVQPFRTMGGRFNLGWPMFGMLIREWVEYSISKGRGCIPLLTYHWSRGEIHRGCRGFEYDRSNALAAVRLLQKQFVRIFGDVRCFGQTVVHPIVVGIETDTGGLVFHGDGDAQIDTAACSYGSDAEAVVAFRALLPLLPEHMLMDILPLFNGNRRHVEWLAGQERVSLDFEHSESAICLGRGFDWLHAPNRALIIGPYEPDLRTPIRTAGSIVLDNLSKGRISANDGIVLMTSGVFRSKIGGIEQKLAEEKALDLMALAQDELGKERALFKNIECIAGSVDLDTRKFHQIEL